MGGRDEQAGGIGSLSRGQDYIGNIVRILGDLQGPDTVVHELIQNADDAPRATRMRFTVSDDALEVWNDGTFARCGDVTLDECEWLEEKNHRCDFHSFRLVGSGDKRGRSGMTGAFGIGFTAVYQLTDRPELISNGEHWAVEEMAAHDDRIKLVTPARRVEGTMFRLPWARNESEFRWRLRQEPISDGDIADFREQLHTSVPRAMPFLKQLDIIEVVSAGRITRFGRERTSECITVTSSDGPELRWALLSGDFDERSAALKAEHPHVIEPARRSDVHIAIPIEGDATSGILYATLPTRAAVHMPLVVNADLYPAGDRKRIRFDDHAAETDWNRAAITAAAELLSSSLGGLPATIGDERLAELLLAAREFHERAGGPEVDDSFGAFWTEIIKRLPTSSIVPTVAGGYGSPRQVRLWSDPTELDAAPLLRSLFVDLVAEPVKDDWYQLRSNEVGIENLHLKHVVSALETCGLTKRRWKTEEPPSGIGWAASIDKLWRLVDTFLRIRDRRDDASRTALQRCAIAPGWDGTIGPVGDVLRADRDLQDLLDDIGVEAMFLDEEWLGGDLPDLLAEVPTATPSQIVLLAEGAFAHGSAADAETGLALLRWVFERRQDFDDDDLPRVAALPIFPTATGPRPLTALALPSNFRDPLALASIAETDGVKEMVPFLGKLGARPLTIVTYCTDFLAPAIQSEELSDVQREAATRLIATHLSEIRDQPVVRHALRPLHLVRCTDGTWRQGSDVYLRDDLRLLVGDEAAIAATPTMHREAHRDLYEWLGAAREPRPRDIEVQCHRLSRGPANHRQIADAIIQHLARRFRDDPEKTEAEFAALKQIAWLPIEGDRSRGHRPELVYLRYQRSLFQSQARFIDIGVVLERGSGDFLRWLGLKEHPTAEQVVSHLLTYASQERPVGKDIWAFLNNHKDDPGLDRLRGERCLLLSNGRYVRPAEVYWRSNPFGRWRHLLDESFSQYKGMLDRLGVAEGPAADHAVEVLLDIAGKHGGEDAALVDEDVDVVRACWRLLSDALADETTVSADLADLRNGEVVLDSRNRLRTPSDVYFRDSLTLAQRFDDVVNRRLIDRPEGMWPGLAAAGVRNLSDAVSTQVLEKPMLELGGMLPHRLVERHRLLVRVLSHDDSAAIPRLDRLQEEGILQRLGRLTIQQTLEIDGDPHTSAPFERGALFLNEEGRFLWVEDGRAEPVWLEVAREVVRALDVDAANAKSVPSVLKDVLSAESEDAARRELDELGYPALDENAYVLPEPGVATGFGGSDVPAAESEGPIAEEDQGGSTPNDSPPSQSPDDRPGPTDAPGPSPRESKVGTTGVGDGSGDFDVGESTKGATTGTSGESSPSTSRGYRRLRSYVVPAGVSWDRSDDESTGIEQEIDRAAVDAVLDYERVAGREPTELPHGHPGYDIRSEAPTGEVRYIEVKGTGARWSEVAISRRQYLEAQRERENYWLYVVDRALSDPQVHPVQDPVSQIDQYVFDDGWRNISEQVDAPRRTLARLNLHQSPGSLRNAVPLRDLDADETVSGWLPCPRNDWEEDWFAVRIEGHALGMTYRGGVAVVRPLGRAPEEDDLLLMRLHEQTDPDTGTATTIRLWIPETDMDGRRLALRLWSRSGVAPLTVTHPEQLKVLGEVVEVLDVDRLEDLGVLFGSSLGGNEVDELQ